MESSELHNNGSKVKSSCNDSNMVKTIKLESFDLNDSTKNTQSFSQLLRNVLSRNSPCSAPKAQHQLPPKTPEVVKPEVAEEQLELNSESAKPRASSLSVTPEAIFRPCSAPAAASTVDIDTPLKVVGTPASDGYSWRKYGQKQLKNTNTFRSYYRCTHFNCVAKKKVQHFEQSGHVINVVHVGVHNHDPPQRSYSRSRCLTSSEKISVPKHAEVPLAQKVDHFNINNTNAQQSSHHTPRMKELYTKISSGDIGRVKSGEDIGEVLEFKQLCSTNGGSPKRSSCWIANVEVQKKHDVEQSPEMRKEDSNKSHLDSISKATEKHKTVVLDAKVSPDGYRWRKYGQKFVKGNSHTRSYYRCKLTGCPARKQVERATNDATEIAITYEWEHNHDVHVYNACVLVSSTAPMTHVNNTNTETTTSQNPSTNRSAERERESFGAKVLKNGVVEDNIFRAKNAEISSVRKTDSSEKNRADVRQTSDHKSGSEPHSSNFSGCNIQKVNVEGQHLDIPKSKQVFCSNERGSQQSSSGRVANTENQEKNDGELEPSPKKRKEESKNSCSDHLKATKKHKIDVQDAADTRISHDSCRWRKYGQKLVKGNSHARSYYRCTSTGCPARKHVETAVNDATATTVTYEGKHKHDAPVSRKQPVPDNPTTFGNAGCAEKIETLTNASSLTKREEEREGEFIGERVMELGGEKALESAQTLLSIKVEVRQ